MFAPPGSPRTFRTYSPHARQIRYAGSVSAAAASCSVADEDYARAGLGGCGPGRADVGQREGPEGDLDRHGFALHDAVRGLLLLHNFTIGFCIEEQAVLQVTASGDDSYSLDCRAELIGPQAAPLAVEAGQVIFGDPDTRFAELVDLLLDTSPGCGRADPDRHAPPGQRPASALPDLGQ
jgi:hypothetical protein